MVIESRFWLEDLENYIRKFRPMKAPPRWSERSLVNFEKDVTLALFMIRRLAEAGKFSDKFKEQKVSVSRCVFKGKSKDLVYKIIDELYELETEHHVTKDVMFICNQFIHAHCTFGIRGQDRNWFALYTCSDFEKRKWIYKVPLSEIVKILQLALDDEINVVKMRYDFKLDDWIIEKE